MKLAGMHYLHVTLKPAIEEVSTGRSPQHRGARGGLPPTGHCTGIQPDHELGLNVRPSSLAAGMLIDAL